MMANNVNVTFPELFTTVWLKNFDKSTGMVGKVNSRFEKELSKHGDTVHVDRIGDFSVGSYTVNGTIQYSNATVTQDSLVLNQTPYIATKLDDLDNAMSNKDLGAKFIERMMVAIRIHTDSHLLGQVANFTHLVGTVAAPTALTGAAVFAALRRAARVLDDANVQEEGRCMPVPPALYEVLGNFSDEKQTEFTMANIGKKELYREVAGIKLFKTTNLPIANNGTNDYFTLPLFIEKVTIDHVQRLNPKNVETLRLQSTFGKGMRMLLLYGTKTFEPNTGVRFHVRATA